MLPLGNHLARLNTHPKDGIRQLAILHGSAVESDAVAVKEFFDLTLNQRRVAASQRRLQGRLHQVLRFGYLPEHSVVLPKQSNATRTLGNLGGLKFLVDRLVGYLVAKAEHAGLFILVK